MLLMFFHIFIRLLEIFNILLQLIYKNAIHLLRALLRQLKETEAMRFTQI